MIPTDLTPSGSPPGPLTERETHGLRAGHPFVVDTAELLDHRTRAQTIPAGDAPAGRYLAYEDGGAGRLFALTRPITHVGRGLIADLRLEDPHVSRRHAIVAMRAEGMRVLDDRSANGTFVNGRAVDVVELSDGDVLRVGRAVFRYVEIQQAAPRGRNRHIAHPYPTAVSNVPDTRAPSTRLSADGDRCVAVCRGDSSTCRPARLPNGHGPLTLRPPVNSRSRPSSGVAPHTRSRGRGP